MHTSTFSGSLSFTTNSPPFCPTGKNADLTVTKKNTCPNGVDPLPLNNYVSRVRFLPPTPPPLYEQREMRNGWRVRACGSSYGTWFPVSTPWLPRSGVLGGWPSLEKQGEARPSEGVTKGTGMPDCCGPSMQLVWSMGFLERKESFETM